MDKFVLVMNFLSFICAYIAAYLWFKSASAKVKDGEFPNGTGNPEIVVDGYLFIESTKLQSKLSAKAATFAGFAAIFQGCVILLGGMGAT